MAWHFSIFVVLVLISNISPESFLDNFTDESSDYSSPQFAEIKQTIDLDPLEVDLWMENVKKSLKRQLNATKKKGSSAIPETTLGKIIKNGGKIPENIARKIRKRGIVIVRDTITPDLIHEWMAQLAQYLYINRGFPLNDTAVYEIYWSKAQVKARQHKNMLVVQRALLDLWHLSEVNEVSGVNLSQPLTYVDRLHIRQPKDDFRLPLHVDGGGIERWKDQTYRQVYRHILDGNWFNYDPFEADYRVEAIMNDSGYTNGCSFFRAFQGWLSMSDSEPGMGTLQVIPLLKEVTAFWMLRPFMSDVPLDSIPGCFPAKTLHITQKWHEDLLSNLVSLPTLHPGDSVWWHPDMVHTLEATHQGTEPNSVFYIPSGPDCRINREYLRRMRHAFVLGKSPPDFPLNNFEEDFIDRATVDDLSDLGLQLGGFPFSSSDASGTTHSSRCNWP